MRDEDGGDPRAVVVLSTHGAPQRRMLARRRRRRAVDPQPEPTPVVTGRATIVAATPLPDGSGGEWLRRLDAELELEDALRTLNRVVQAHRIATADPYVHELSAHQAIAIRAGFGSGEHVADGAWNEALELPAPGERRRQRRASVLRPQERMAALLAARDSALACEELTLRARADLDADRAGAAALGTRLALEAALVELAPTLAAPDMGRRLDELRELRDDVIAAANSALAAPLSEPQRETVARALGRIEAALRARAAAST